MRLFIAFFMLSFGLHAQDPTVLFMKLVKKFQAVKSYEVQATIKPNIPLIRILPVKAKVSFSYPNNFQIHAAGISILPKNGFSELPKLFGQAEKFTAISTGNENLQNQDTEIITLLPLDNEGDLVLAKLWVDVSRLLILKSQVSTRTNGTLVSEYFYGTSASKGLPDRMLVTVEVKKFKMPKGIATDINRNSQPEDAKKAQKKGTIEVLFSHYEIH
jgi:hypothetical protein